MLEYRRHDTSLTLQDGLDVYYASRDDLATGRGLSDEAREFFRCHDAAHVVFGCSTSLSNEAMVKIWSFFGTTAGFSLMRAYRLPESKEIYEKLALREIVTTTLRSFSLVPRVFVRCRRMHERWPWSQFESHLGTPLLELRRKYGIEVLTAP